MVHAGVIWLRYRSGVVADHPDAGDFVCPECGHAEYRLTDAAVNEMAVYKCAGCGFAFLNPARYCGQARPKRNPG